MALVILDTNFLLIPAKFKIDIFEEIARVIDDAPEFTIVKETVDELESIRESQDKSARDAAALALAMLKKKISR